MHRHFAVVKHLYVFVLCRIANIPHVACRCGIPLLGSNSTGAGPVQVFAFYSTYALVSGQRQTEVERFLRAAVQITADMLFAMMSLSADS